MANDVGDRFKLRFRRFVGLVTGNASPLPQRQDPDTTDPAPAAMSSDITPLQAEVPQPGGEDFDTLLREGRVRTVFQPIVSLTDGQVFGYEALSRGPIGTRLESADALFQAAKRRGVTRELERVCRFRAIASASSLPPGAYLFLNISPQVFEEPNAGLSRDVMERSHLAQERIVLEITEKEAIADFERFKKILLHYNRQGFKVAIDDAGAGHNSLRAVTEVRPHFIKLDMALVRDIDRDRAKNALVSAILMFARRIDARVLAEGIETVEELATLIDLGVDYGQGYLLARPSAAYVCPKPEIAAFIREQSKSNRGTPMPKRVAIASIARRAPALMLSAHTSEVLEIFDRNPELDSVVLTEFGVPAGLITRAKLYERLSNPFGYAVYAKRPARLVMDDSYLAVDVKEPIDDVSRRVVHRRRTSMYDEIVVLENGMYTGVVSMRDLLHAMTEFQASLSRYANPLTGLPGRVAVQQEIERRNAAAVPFAVLHIDLNHFRTYNERHGFGRGDEVIKALAECLVDVAKVKEAESFVGHLGGVNFAILVSDKAAEQLGLDILDRFELKVAPPEVTLTIAGITAEPPTTSYHAVIGRASRLKRMARSMHRSVFVLDGRVLRGPELARPQQMM